MKERVIFRVALKPDDDDKNAVESINTARFNDEFSKIAKPESDASSI